ncbi:EEF1A lysine methyltransferase 2 [Anoplophora glabripennis]|uniref:EEF1A lysine methyltransferase 2 n=1 Tax=Anoplophora glabripennis TaxID=217634 RepID=UPI000874A187|nr:EEF1A lysine methyltransferase 2 [Anoplophora glabripennis]
MDELNASELGKLDYWENCYDKELNNFHNHGDPGEIWFGDDIVNRIIQWMEMSELVKKDSKLLDIGCGNGMFVVELANEGFTNLHGVDYSEKAVELAKAIANKQNLNIHFSTQNILDGLRDKFDIIHDKGTYDAISLSENALENRNVYINNVYDSLNNNGLFIITSCNWTESELIQQFKMKFESFHTIPTPQFKFGGKVGSVVSSCVFKRK